MLKLFKRPLLKMCFWYTFHAINNHSEDAKYFFVCVCTKPLYKFHTLQGSDKQRVCHNERERLSKEGSEERQPGGT